VKGARVCRRYTKGSQIDSAFYRGGGGHRCLQRHGISRLPEGEGAKPSKKKFKAYPIGYFHIDIAELQTAEGKLTPVVRKVPTADVKLPSSATSNLAGSNSSMLPTSKTCWRCFVSHKSTRFRVMQLMPGIGPTSAQRALDHMTNAADPITALLDAPSPPRAVGSFRLMARSIFNAWTGAMSRRSWPLAPPPTRT
jgi:hypothetical protein